MTLRAPHVSTQLKVDRGVGRLQEPPDGPHGTSRRWSDGDEDDVDDGDVLDDVDDGDEFLDRGGSRS